MKFTSKRTGFSVVELLVIVLVVAAVVFVLAMSKTSRNNKMVSDSSKSTPVSDVATAPTISSASDLDIAKNALDSTDPSSSNNTDVNQLDQQLSGL